MHTAMFNHEKIFLKLHKKPENFQRCPNMLSNDRMTALPTIGPADSEQFVLDEPVFDTIVCVMK